jgi:hypothetical protein
MKTNNIMRKFTQIGLAADSTKSLLNDNKIKEILNIKAELESYSNVAKKENNSPPDNTKMRLRHANTVSIKHFHKNLDEQLHATKDKVNNLLAKAEYLSKKSVTNLPANLFLPKER